MTADQDRTTLPDLTHSLTRCKPTLQKAPVRTANKLGWPGSPRIAVQQFATIPNLPRTKRLPPIKSSVSVAGMSPVIPPQ